MIGRLAFTFGPHGIEVKRCCQKQGLQGPLSPGEGHMTGVLGSGGTAFLTELPMAPTQSCDKNAPCPLGGRTAPVATVLERALLSASGLTSSKFLYFEEPHCPHSCPAGSELS